MSQTSPAIPPVTGLDKATQDILKPLRENIEILKGRRGSFPKRLGPSATDQDRNNKINEILDWLQQ